MLKIMVEQWDKNKDLLKEELSKTRFEDIDYKKLVEMTFGIVYNTGLYSHLQVVTDKTTEIDDGDYQGTLLYLLPFDTYQPAEYEYLMTCVGYGSCSGCDTLLAISHYDDGVPTEEQLGELMVLCKDILTNTIKPYNCGWRNDENFVEISEEQ